MTEIRQSSSSHLRFSHAPENIMKRCFDNAAPGAIKKPPLSRRLRRWFCRQPMILVYLEDTQPLWPWKLTLYHTTSRSSQRFSSR